MAIKDISFSLTGGMALCLGESVLKGNSSDALGEYTIEEYIFTAQGVGFSGSTCGSYDLNETISIGAEIGYRYFTTGYLRDKDGIVWQVESPDPDMPHKMDLDFNGPFIAVNLSFKMFPRSNGLL